MSHNYEGLSHVPLREFVKVSHISFDLLARALSTRNNVIRPNTPVQTILGRISLFDLVTFKSLKDTEMPFSESGVGDNFVTRHFGDLPGSLDCPAKITAVQPDEAFSCQPLGQCARLRHALLGQRAIKMTLTLPLKIPRGFPVTNDDELSSVHGDCALPAESENPL